MSNIDRVGYFRGDVLDRGVSLTTNGYPQLTLMLRATEKYNEENEVWEPWPYEECEAQGYICLFGGNGKPTLGVGQAMKALNWDGAAFETLATDTSVDKIQWQMESSTYNERTRIQVGWIDAYDAAPGRKCKKLDTGDLRKIDAKYAVALRAIGGGPKPASARPQAPKPAPAPVKETPAADPTPPTTVPAPASVATPVATPSAEPPFTPDPPAPVAEPEKPKRTRKPSVPAAPSAPATPPPAAAGPVSQADAWESVYNVGKAKGKTDKEITAAWSADVYEQGGDEKVGADWSGVRDRVIAKLS